MCGTPYTPGLLGFQKARVCAGTACFAQVMAGRTGHLGQAEQGCSSQLEHGLPWGVPQSCRAWQEGRGSPCPFPLLLDTASSFPFPICRPWLCVQEQVRALPGPAKQRLHRASPVRGQRPGQAGAWGPGGAVRTPHPAALYPVPTSFLTLPDVPSVSHYQQMVGAVSSLRNCLRGESCLRRRQS